MDILWGFLISCVRVVAHNLGTILILFSFTSLFTIVYHKTPKTVGRQWGLL
jgi:hypothetical protein